MPIHHDTPENPHTKEPYFEEKKAPFTESSGTHEIVGADNAPVTTDNDPKPDDLGGLVDPDLEALNDGT
jgi:hypothetical protein